MKNVVNHAFMAKKKFYSLALFALVAVAFSSCNMFGGDPEYHLSNLQGLWLENGDTVEGHYVRFTDEETDTVPFLFGREWTLADDKTEEDLFAFWEKYGIHGNGWFKYWLETKGELTEIHLMDDGGAEIPKVYVVSKLNATTLQYYEKDDKKIKYSFTRIEESQNE